MIRVWRYWFVRTKDLFLVSQFALLTTVLFLAVCDREVYPLTLPFHSNLGKLGLVLLLVSPQICSYFIGLYQLISGPDSRPFLIHALASLVMGLLFMIPLFFVFPHLFPGYLGALAAVLVSALVLIGLRPLVHLMIRHKQFVEGLLVLGTGDLARKFYDELTNKTNGGAQKTLPANGILPGNAAGHPETFDDSSEMIGYGELREITLRDRITRIVVAEPDAEGSEGLALALLECKLRGLEVEEIVASYEKLNSKIWLEALRPEWLVYSNGFKPSKYYLVLKRLFDTACAFLMLFPAALLFIPLAIAIRLESEGPVFLRQLRVGLNGKEFVLFKFRTMRTDAERDTGPVWASESDRRVTRVGRYLRKFRLDELPQLINVLRGDMSLVGPRPERPFFVDLLGKHIHYYGLRHCVKPGVTGWAQVLYPYGASIQDAYEKLQYDLYYAKHMSLAFDLGIFLATFKVVLFGRGQ